MSRSAADSDGGSSRVWVAWARYRKLRVIWMVASLGGGLWESTVTEGKRPKPRVEGGMRVMLASEGTKKYHSKPSERRMSECGRMVIEALRCFSTSGGRCGVQYRPSWPLESRDPGCWESATNLSRSLGASTRPSSSS